MNNSAYLVTDGFGILLLLLMISNFGSKHQRSNEIDNVFFNGMVLGNLFILIADMMTIIFNGAHFEGARFWIYFSNLLYFLIQPIICLFWVLYCEIKLNSDVFKNFRNFLILIISVVSLFVMTFISCFTPFVFTIDANNLYQRSNYYILYTAICFGYFIFTYHQSFKALKKEKNYQQRKDIYYLLVYPLLPLVCAIIQSFFLGVALVWTGSVISTLILYFNIQNVQITTDSLTGINNRRRFENFMDYRLKNRKLPYLFLFMIDVDKFKDINDKFGHNVGDTALRQVTQILIKTVDRSDFLARIGGDEFVVVGERNEIDEIQILMNQISDEIQRFNSEHDFPYNLSLSIGHTILEQSKVKTTDQILIEADQEMYDSKKGIAPNDNTTLDRTVESPLSNRISKITS